MPPARRLTAILAADVAGYSRLMGADEERTHERLKAHLQELVNPKITEHRGRIVKNTGDGLLAEFPSVVDAVRCAVEIQRGMGDRELEILEDTRIRFRIGINLGDVIADGDDIFGDGVNIAARLEGLAEPGEICVSARVHEAQRKQALHTRTHARVSLAQAPGSGCARRRSRVDGYRCTMVGCGRRATHTSTTSSRGPRIARACAGRPARQPASLRATHDAQIKEQRSGRRARDGRLVVKGCNADGWPVA